MEDRQNLLTIAQMAKLCGTTKATLYHYEREKVFSPYLVDENGYRWYRLDQVYRYEAVHLLQQQGLSLSEIREYLDRRSYASFQQLLETTRDRLEQSIRTLVWEREMVENTLRHLSVLQPEQTDRLGEPTLQTLPERRYLVTPSAGHVANALNQHNLDRMADQGEMDLFISGMIEEEAYLAGRVDISYLCSRVDPAENKEHPFCRYRTLPAGQYAVVHLNYGEWPRTEGVQMLTAFLQEQALCPAGPMVVDEMIDPLSNKNHNESIYTLSVRAERD